MIVFAHLLNDRSGSTRMLKTVIELIGTPGSDILYLGGGSKGLLGGPRGGVRHYWYRRSQMRAVTLLAYFLSQLILFVRLLSNRRIERDSLVYVNTLMPFGAALFGWMTGRPVVYHLHEVSVGPAPLRALLLAIARLTATRLVYVSDAHRALLPIADERAATIHNALDPAFLAAGAGAGSCKRPFEVVMLSYNRAYKGVPEFVALADRLLARHDIRFHLVLSDGAGELAGMPQPANLTIHPPSDRPETFYRRAGAVLNLSRPDLCVETFGLTLLEAMAFGVPVIAPPVGGPAELVRDGCEGYLIDSREGQALADAVERLTDDDVTYRAMSLAARARAQQFDVPRFRAALFDTIAAARQTRQRPGKAMS